MSFVQCGPTLWVGYGEGPKTEELSQMECIKVPMWKAKKLVEELERDQQQQQQREKEKMSSSTSTSSSTSASHPSNPSKSGKGEASYLMSMD